jgi:uracil-DNA glycosylase family 4
MSIIDRLKGAVQALEDLGVESLDDEQNDELEPEASEKTSESDVNEHKAPEVCHGRGKKGAKVAFIGASPSRLDIIRKKVFSGPVGATVRDLYIGGLGLTEDEVYLGNIVPLYLSTDNDTPREPNAEEVAKWMPSLDAEIAEIEPAFVVALGKTAHNALAGIAEVWVPHPRAVNIYGDSGEVGRKLRKLATAVAEISEKPAATEITPSEGTKSVDHIAIAKTDDERQIVYGVAMEPGVYDTDQNWTSSDEIEGAAHYFMQNFQQIGTEHTEVITKAYPVESYLAPCDLTIGDKDVKTGSWVMGIKIEDTAEWELVKSGEYTGFSIGALANIDPENMME